MKTNLQKHTPGPWHWAGTNKNPKGRHYLRGAEFQTVMVNFDDEPSVDDARLIATAPELLEACQYVQPHLAEYVQWHHRFAKGCSVEMEQALDLINAAILKATEGK